MNVARASLLAASLSGCATIERGTTQIVSIEPEPSDATCVVKQGAAGVPIAATGGKVEVPRSRLDLFVTCTKPGYETATVDKLAMYAQKPFGGVSFLVDISSGANYSYPPMVRVPLTLAK